MPSHRLWWLLVTSCYMKSVVLIIFFQMKSVGVKIRDQSRERVMSLHDINSVLINIFLDEVS